ncbi:MAG: M56 family metallopeptidase [Planctomycetota bacterium]|jgi:beta-lactamase regulating signal transducer with metallopeptidase domain/Flp pilus assembly secretin CpaC
MITLENILSQEIVQKLGWVLLHFVWQAAAVALLLAILLRILRKSTANLRYIISCLALGLIVLLPIVTMQVVPASIPQSTVNVEPAPAVLPIELTKEIPAAEMTVSEEPVPSENVGTNYIALVKQRAAELLEPALPYIVSGWLFGVFGLSLWHLGGWTQLQRLKRKMVKQVDQRLYSKLSQLAQKLGINQTVQLMESALVQIPTVVGWLRPVILLPASALTGLNSDQLEALLAHELAHVRRYDYLVNMLQTVIEILGFYHPAVWWISHKIRAERENCCDDLAVSISGDRVRYARALTTMEEIRTGRGALAVAASGGNLLGRIRRLIGKEFADNSRVSWIPSVIAILLIATIAIPATLALKGQTNEKSDTKIEAALLDGFRENKDELQCQALSWIQTTMMDGFIPDSKFHTKGTFQLWWEGEKIATEYTREAFNTIGDGLSWGEKRQDQISYNDDLSPVKSKSDLNGNWLDIIRQLEASAHEKMISELKMLKNVTRDWSIAGTNDNKHIKLLVKNLEDSTYKIQNYASAKGMTLVREESYDDNEKLHSKHTIKLQPVAGGVWFPVEIDMKVTDTEQKKNVLRNQFKLDLKKCSFNDTSAIPDGIFEVSTATDQGQLNDPLMKSNDIAPTDNTQRVPVLTKSPIPSAEDKAHIRIDCLTVEVFPDLKIDRETIIVAENILGKKITLTDSTASAKDLLKKAAKATGEVEDESAGDKRVTQEQFKALVEMLTSRGYLKILMSPELLVVDSQTAKIQTNQDSLQITPHIREDGNILLQVEVSISRQSTQQSKEQKPSITKTDISTQALVSPGMSLIIGGIKEAEKSTGAEEQTPEALVIIMPTLAASVTEPQRQKESNIDKDAIQIETRILTVSDDFLEDIGLDVNSPIKTEVLLEHKPMVVPIRPVSTGFEKQLLMLDDLHISFLLKAVEAHKDAHMLAAPRVIVRDGEKAKIAIETEVPYISGYGEPNRPSEEPVPKLDYVNDGIELELLPKIMHDDKHIELDLDFKFSKVTGSEKRMYKEKYPYEVPLLNKIRSKSHLSIADGGTVLLTGQKITREITIESSVPILGELPILRGLFHRHDKTEKPMTLLILVKPTIAPQEQAKAIPHGKVDSKDLENPLERALEYMTITSVEPNKRY